MKVFVEDWESEADVANLHHTLNQQWHQTEVIDNVSISYTGTIVDWLNRDSVEEELLRDCELGAQRISITQETCDDLQARCFDHWRHEFGQRPSDDTIMTVHRSSMFVLDDDDGDREGHDVEEDEGGDERGGVEEENAEDETSKKTEL